MSGNPMMQRLPGAPSGGGFTNPPAAQEVGLRRPPPQAQSSQPAQSSLYQSGYTKTSPISQINYNPSEYSQVGPNGSSAPSEVSALPPSSNKTHLKSFLNQAVKEGGSGEESYKPQLGLNSGPVSKIRNRGPCPSSTAIPESTGQGLQDSSGMNFDFKEKMKDSTYPSHIQSGLGVVGEKPTSESGFQSKGPTLSIIQEDLHRESQYRSKASNSNNLSQKDLIEYGDHSERITHLLMQNRDLKELVIKKEASVAEYKASNKRLEKELQNLMDPLSKNSQMKAVYSDN